MTLTLLEEIYRDTVATLAMSGGDADRSLCANQLRAIRNRLRPMLSPEFVRDAEIRATYLANSRQ